MARNTLNPTLSQTFRILHDEEAPGKDINFGRALARSRRAEEEGQWEEACNIRLEAMQALAELLPEEEPVELDWEDVTTREALTVAYYSAVDHFLVGDMEMAAAALEMVLDADGDDHLEATTLLAFVYVAMGEWECFDDIVSDLGDKSPERSLLLLWSDFERNGRIYGPELATLARYHKPYLREWCAESHPADGRYLADIGSERPTKEARARELWLQTEHLWSARPEFIEALRREQH